MSGVLRVGVAGARGRLGREIATRLGPDFAGGLVRPGAGDAPSFEADPAALLARIDVLIDVSRADAVGAHAAAAASAGVPLVLGVTGYGEAANDAIRRAATAIPVLAAANFSVGVAVLRVVARRLASVLPEAEFDAEILEIHHRGKRDAPSGTALAICRSVADGRGQDPVPTVFHAHPDGRDTGPRPTGSIGFAVQRAGAVVGEHQLSFTSDTEQVTVSHRAFDRGVFAAGAIRAARWLPGRPAGLYGMEHVLGLA